MTERASPLLDRDYNWQPETLTPAYKSSRLRAPRQPLLSLPETIKDVAGPVFGHNILGARDADLVTNAAAPGHSAMGPRILVHGCVLDENGKGVPGALLEVWQANAGGRYRHKNDDYLAPLDPHFAGCGRTITDAQGRYQFLTIQPGAYPWPNHANAWRPMHIHFSVFGHAFAQRLITQMYFERDPLIALCPIVQTVKDPQAIDQLTAKLDMDRAVSMDHLAYRFDLVLRGRRSTVFENRSEGN